MRANVLMTGKILMHPVLIAAICLSTGGTPPSQRLSWVVSRNGIVVKISLMVVNTSDSVKSRYWGWFEGRLYVIKDLIIKYKSHYVGAPLSSYSDLSCINDVSLLPKGKGAYVIAIDGGDASTGYEAKIFFDSKNVYRREVHDGEESEYDYEVTNYTNKVPPDP